MKSLTAVFFVDFTPMSGGPLNAWISAGHQVAAVVAYQPKSRGSARYRRDIVTSILAPPWSTTGALRRHRIPLVRLTSPVKWDVVTEFMAGLDADILVSIGFPLLIPSAVTDIFRRGGVNLHPSLLPAYRGPHPVHAIVRDQAASQFGGMTLHCLSEQFDAGDIIAQEHLGEEAYTGRSEEGLALARSAARLVVSGLPGYCEGCGEPAGQAGGDWPIARISPEPMVLGPEFSLERAKSLMSVFIPHPGVAVRTAHGMVRVGALRAVLGPPRGQAPLIRRWTVDVDFADVRVRLLRENRVLRRWRRLRGIARLIGQPGIE